jgi:hypothetical protein
MIGKLGLAHLLKPYQGVALRAKGIAGVESRSGNLG